MVILGSAIVTHLKNTGRTNVKIRRAGTKINSISFEAISFLEIRKLLSVDFSLGSAAKMCGLKIGTQKARSAYTNISPLSLSQRKVSFPSGFYDVRNNS